MTRRRRQVVLVALAAVAGSGLAVALAPRETAGERGGSPATEEAARACRSAAEFERLVRANRPVDQVLATLTAAERQAALAADSDPSWLALSGGLGSLRLALEADDARAARTGIDVVRAECRRVRDLAWTG